MILDSSKPASKRSWWSAVTTALIIGWAGFALTGSTDVQAGQENDDAETARGVLVKEEGLKVPNKCVAYFIALAMESVDGLFNEYPLADLDQDGELTVEEALALFKAEKMRMWTEGPAAIEQKLAERTAEEEPAEGKLRPIGEEPAGPKVKPFGDRRPVIKRQPFTSGVLRWLLDNRTQDPDADAVAEYTAIVAEIQLTEFLERHPEADADGDGTLTVEERDEYFQLLRTFKETKVKVERIRRIEAIRKIELEAAGRD